MAQVMAGGAGVRTGLVLGKFAPLHRGHQLLIETAQAENDLVLVMIYDSPEVTSIELAVRVNWLRKLYPAVEVIEAWDGPMDVGDSPELKRRHEDYILRTLAGRNVTHFYSSEFYGEHVSEALGAVDRRIDEARGQFVVSGTAVRSDPFAHCHFLHPQVYRDLVTRVVLLGAPSTGKTTLAAALAEKFNTVWMPEYGREYWENHQCERRLTPEQLVEIAKGHREREDVLMLEANRIIFIDTDATTTFQFSMYYHGFVQPKLMDYAAQSKERYDLFFLCGTDIPFDDTWDRSGVVQREQMQNNIAADLVQREINFTKLLGSLETRIAVVEAALPDAIARRT